MSTTPDSLAGQTIADRYRILELLGEGGMGRVYLAEHVRMGRKSAVKVLNPALAVTADAISRFHREAANASRINHPNVAAIYDFGETSDGMLYLAMEFVEGETLTALLEREGRLAIPRAAQLVKQAADALAAAHHLGIVHRDLKPDNIMVARHLDGSDWVKVVDFGIAKAIGERSGSQTVTTAGVSIGTPEYMSPEQLAGEKLDARTDVYSLALVLFHVLTGTLPYPGVTSRETLVRRLTAPPRTLREVAPDVDWPTGIQRALDRALATEMSERYSSVGDFGRDVLATATAATAEISGRATVRLPTPAPAARGTSTPLAHAAAPPARAVSASPAVPLQRSGVGTRIVVGALIVLAAVATLAFRSRSRAPRAGSIAGPAPAAADSLRAASESVRAHFEQAIRFLAAGRATEAQREYRDAGLEVRALRSRLDPAGARELDEALRRMRQQSFDACVAARSGANGQSAAAHYPCERMFERPGFPGRQRRSGQQ